MSLHFGYAAGMSGSGISKLPMSPNSVFFESAFSCWYLEPYFISTSMNVSPLAPVAMYIPLSSPKQSSAPLVARHSKLLRLNMPMFMRCTKSKMLLNGPFFRRSSIMFSAAENPMPFIAASPKRMFPCELTPNFRLLSLTSGERVCMPMALLSSMSFLISLMSERLRLITAAMYSGG